jgi:hypothetical protein
MVMFEDRLSIYREQDIIAEYEEVRFSIREWHPNSDAH